MKEPLEEKGITLTYDENVLEKIADKSYDQKFGARDIRKVIRTDIEDKIANTIIENPDMQINNLVVSLENDEITVNISSSIDLSK